MYEPRAIKQNELFCITEKGLLITFGHKIGFVNEDAHWSEVKVFYIANLTKRNLRNLFLNK